MVSESGVQPDALIDAMPAFIAAALTAIVVHFAQHHAAFGRRVARSNVVVLLL